MAGRFSVEAIFKAVDKITAPVTRMQNRIGKFTRATSAGLNRINRATSDLSKKFKQVGVAAVASTALISGAMAGAVTTGAQFEQTLVNAAAKFPGEIRQGTQAFTELEAAARKTGATTEFSASEAAGALNFLAMAGFDAEASVAALPGVVDLATAAQVDLATATDIASDSLGAFGLATKDPIALGKNLARVNDVIAKTTTSANTTVGALFETFKEAAPSATAAGASIETVSALAGELANSGLKAGRAGTVLKNMFARLQAPKVAAAAVISRLGVQTQDSSGSMLDIIDILDQFNTKTAKLTDTQRNAAIQTVFGMEALGGVQVLLKSGSDRLREYRTQLEGASGASGTMAAVMRDTVQGRLNSLKSAVEGVTISIFSLNRGPLADAITGMTDWVRANEQVIATNIGGFLAGIVSHFEQIVTWGKRIAIGVGVFMGLNAVLGLITGTMTALNLIMAANPLVLGIMAAVAAVALLYAAWEPIKGFFADLWGGVVEIFNSALSSISGIVDQVMGAASAVVDTVSSAASFLGFGEDKDEERGAVGYQPSYMVSPQDRTASSLSETTTTNKSEVTIKDETGRAEQTKGKMGAGLTMASTGAF